MLSLRPNARADAAVTVLRDAAREAGNVLGGNDNAPDRIVNAYRQWASTQSRMVNQLFADDEIPRLIATPRYWSLHGVDVAGFTSAALSAYVRQELEERVAFLDREAAALENEHNRWNPKFPSLLDQRHPLTAVVLDTNVMLTHHADLAVVQWHSLTGVPLNESLGLAVPIQVIRELDRLKMANNNNINRGTKDELRKDAGAALKLVEDILDPEAALVLKGEGDNPNAPELRMLLVADRVPGQPIPDPDAEIVDRAVSLLPFAGGVHLLSYDAAIVFRARLAGIKARKLSYGWDGTSP